MLGLTILIHVHKLHTCNRVDRRLPRDFAQALGQLFHKKMMSGNQAYSFPFSQYPAIEGSPPPSQDEGAAAGDDRQGKRASGTSEHKPHQHRMSTDSDVEDEDGAGGGGAQGANPIKQQQQQGQNHMNRHGQSAAMMPGGGADGKDADGACIVM